jgi:hypothetical protein
LLPEPIQKHQQQKNAFGAETRCAHHFGARTVFCCTALAQGMNREIRKSLNTHGFFDLARILPYREQVAAWP